MLSDSRVRPRPELGSPNYDVTSVTALLGARAWAKENNDSALLTASGRWLRAYFTLAALATVPGPATAAPIATFVDNGLTHSPMPAGFRGPAVVLAGQRACPQNWGFTSRPRMLSRALGLGGNAQGTPTLEAVWARLEALWSLPPAAAGNLYGLSTSDVSQLRDHVNGVSCPSMVNAALAGVQTKARVDVAGWRNAAGWGSVRASTSGPINQVALLGEVFVSQSRGGYPANSVHVVFPWWDPPYPSCTGTEIAGTVEMILTGDRHILYTPPGGSKLLPIAVDLPDVAEDFSFAIGPNGLINWSCSP